MNDDHLLFLLNKLLYLGKDSDKSERRAIAAEIKQLLSNAESAAFERGRVQGRTEIITAINHYMDNVSGLVDDAGDTPA